MLKVNRGEVMVILIMNSWSCGEFLRNILPDKIRNRKAVIYYTGLGLIGSTCYK